MPPRALERDGRVIAAAPSVFYSAENRGGLENERGRGMKRLLALCVAVLPALSVRAAEPPPNFLVIFADDK
jgi:hypothetical protein